MSMNYILKIVLITLFILIANLFPQANDINYSSDGFICTLNIGKEPYIIEGHQKRIIDYYNFVDETKPGSPVLPSKTFIVALPPYSNLKVQLINQKFDFIKNVIPRSNPKISLASDSSLIYSETQIAQKHYKSKFFPSQLFEITGYTWIRDYYCATIKINTHRYNWQKRQVEILNTAKLKVQFDEQRPFKLNTSGEGDFDESLKDVIINYEQAINFRSFQPLLTQDDSTGNWIDYSKEYVKLKIPNDGIYRIFYDDVIDYGLNPAQINPLTFKVYWKGQQISIFVFGENDNSFDPGDYIEFWATKNYGSTDYRTLVPIGEEYLEYMNRYTDTTIVWLTWDGENGERMLIHNTYTPGLTDSITTHLVKIHLEQNKLLWYYGFVQPRVQLPFWQENKYWKWLQVRNTSNTPFDFSAEAIVPNTPVYTLSHLSSWFVDTQIIRNNAHKYGAKMNSTDIQDSVIFDWEDQGSLEAIFNSNDLVEGINQYRIVGMPNDSNSTNKALVDWVDIDYYRYNNSTNDSILINIPDSASTGLRKIKVNNITVNNTSLLVYKINPIMKNIVNFQLINNILTFTDTVSGGDRYYIISDDYLQSPVFIKKKQFINLRDESIQADYVLVSNKILEQSVSEYKNFISSNYDVNIQTVFVEDIYDEFGFGYLSPESIQEFLQYAYNYWQSPKPSYLTLIGDATYDYKDYFVGVPSPRKQILVPSYGNPVSDVWFTMWDTSQVNIQQMFVGRIPANNNEEVYRYLDKHQTYFNRDFDDWNKKFLLFSGGDPNLISELNLIKQANDRVLNNIVEPSPVGGSGIHFYKTVDPPTNFGPFTFEEIQDGLDEGGLFISYVGHSGTRTWDNGITDVDDLENAYDDRLPLVSDNGCSTAKFAEPDVDAFGELFINQDERGQAIIYLVNTSLGYTSTAFRMPELFYNRLVANPSESVGKTHFLTKMDNFNQYGFGTVNRLYNYTNLLLGDPIIKFATPEKPNFVVKPDFIKILESVLTENDDSANVELIVTNLGRADVDSLNILLTGIYSDSTLYSILYNLSAPLFKDTMDFMIPIFGLVGEHILRVEMDPTNLIDEISKDDNIASINFLVSSTNLRPIEAEKFYTSSRSIITLLNPTIQSGENPDKIEFAYAPNDSFVNQTVQLKNLDTLITQISLNGLIPQQRYYWRTRLNSEQFEWGATYSFYNGMNYKWLLNKSFKKSDIIENKVMFDSLTSKWELVDQSNILKITSAGFNDGFFASIQYNLIEYVPNTFFRGFATAIIDTVTLQPQDVQIFNYWAGGQQEELIGYLNSLSLGTVLAFAAADEVSVYFSGTVGDSLRQIIKSFGSELVDSIGWRDSWCMIGIKGSQIGSVQEDFSKSSTGTATIDTSKELLATNGFIQLPKISNSVKWQSVFKSDSLAVGSSLDYYVRGIKSDNTVDTLGMVTFAGDSADLSFIDANVYPQIDFFVNFTANSSFESPKFKSLGVNFVPPPELGTNYQVVTSTADTVTIGEDVGLNFYVYNVGESTADSFNVKVEIINDDNSRNTIFEQIVDSLSSEQRKFFEINYNTSSGTGAKTFLIYIDSDKQITELYEDNNFYTVPFFIKQETTSPTLKISFDGNDILDGDYISPKPEIKIEMSDESLIPITDTSAVTIFLNDEPVYYANNQTTLSIEFSEENPKAVVTYTPEFEDGEYFLKVFGQNSLGNIVDSSGLEKHFLVSNEAKLLYVYNYPNPTSGETHFTFKLTQIPDEMRIKIYTIAGRLIKDIKIPATDLTYDFNKIYWDGRDEDGDIIANGVYLYKVILTVGDKTEDVIQKLAIVR